MNDVTKKVVDMQVLIRSGVDCEFYDTDGDLVAYGEIFSIDDDGKFISEFGESWTICKPRTEWWQSSQNINIPIYKLDEAGFLCRVGINGHSILVEGIKDDYLWPWAV